MFLGQSVEILSVFNTLTLKQVFLKIFLFFRRAYVESTQTENAIFPYKTDLSETNVKKNGMVSTKWTYRKERSFASNYFIFLKIGFRVRTSYKESVWCTSYSSVHIHTFYKRLSFISGWLFPASIFNFFWWRQVARAIFNNFSEN